MYKTPGFETRISSEKIGTEKEKSKYLTLGIKIYKMF